jgi:hypothetical protein
MSARRVDDPRDSLGAVKTRAATAAQLGQGTVGGAAPIAAWLSIVPWSGHR